MVEDTGTGMPKAVLDRAMEPFYTTKGVGKGTGLGLAMVYRTVKAHQGQMEIHSQPGQGTKVRMRFPACERSIETTVPHADVPSGTSQRSLTVLLVDDDDLMKSSVQAILQSLGHAVFATASGEEALMTIEAGFQPEVVILDINMPGLGGSGTLPRLRAMLPNVPVLLSTGRADQAALDLAKAFPFVTLLAKPFDFRELQQCLERIGQD
jgi:CheY-like chemotaxis protein